MVLNLAGKAVLHSLSLDGLCKEHSPKEAADNFQRIAL